MTRFKINSDLDYDRGPKVTLLKYPGNQKVKITKLKPLKIGNMTVFTAKFAFSFPPVLSE